MPQKNHARGKTQNHKPKAKPEANALEPGSELKAIKNQLSFFQELLDVLPIPVFYKDVNGIYLGCNQAFCAFFKVSKNQVIGKTVYDLNQDKATGDIFRKADLQLFISKQPQSYETEVKNGTGEVRKVWFNKSVFYNEDGALGGLIGSFVDITDKALAEHALHRSENRYHSIFELSPEAIFLITPSGIVTEVNNWAYRQLGYAREEFLDKHFSDLPCLTQEGKNLVVEKFYQRLSGKKIPPYELHLVKKDGTLIKGVIHGTQIYDENQLPLVTLIMIRGIPESELESPDPTPAGLSQARQK